jgi:hypothetical protein
MSATTAWLPLPVTDCPCLARGWVSSPMTAPKRALSGATYGPLKCDRQQSSRVRQRYTIGDCGRARKAAQIVRAPSSPTPLKAAPGASDHLIHRAAQISRCSSVCSRTVGAPVPIRRKRKRAAIVSCGGSPRWRRSVRSDSSTRPTIVVPRSTAAFSGQTEAP